MLFALVIPLALVGAGWLFTSYGLIHLFREDIRKGAMGVALGLALFFVSIVVTLWLIVFWPSGLGGSIT